MAKNTNVNAAQVDSDDGFTLIGGGKINYVKMSEQAVGWSAKGKYRGSQITGEHKTLTHLIDEGNPELTGINTNKQLTDVLGKVASGTTIKVTLVEKGTYTKGPGKGKPRYVFAIGSKNDGPAAPAKNAAPVTADTSNDEDSDDDLPF